MSAAPPAGQNKVRISDQQTFFLPLNKTSYNKFKNNTINSGYKNTWLNGRRRVPWALCAGLCDISVLLSGKCWVRSSCFCSCRGLWGLVGCWRSFLRHRLVFLRIELRVTLHTLLHGPELLQTLGALHLLFTVVETREGILKFSPTWTAGHPTQAGAVPVDFPTGKNES